MLILPKDDEALSAQRMERIPDRDFTRQNRGIMSPLQTKAARTGRASRR
jgi:hypothetical protein